MGCLSMPAAVGNECQDREYYDKGSNCDNSYADDNYSDLAVIDDEKPKKNYIILKESEIKKCLEDDITQVSDVLSISRSEATALLYHYGWNHWELIYKWFDDGEKVRTCVGLNNQRVIADGELTCDICNYLFRSENFVSAACGHRFCKICYSKHIRVKIGHRAVCLCPKSECQVVVDPDMIESLAKLSDKDKLSDNHKTLYERSLLRSYVEKTRKGIIEWCPGENCKNALEFCFDYNNIQNFDVVCDCSWEFCWKCREEMHSPADCETVAKWIEKYSSKSENRKFILANTKPCPGCTAPIEKNAGCMHMICQCSYEFCWLCLSDWKQHDSRSCNFYGQNKDKVSKEDLVRDYGQNKDKISMEDLVREKRYAHYYERWATNGALRNKAREDLKTLKTEHMVELGDRYVGLQPQLKAIEEAWIQISECRRVLRWSYACGYYLDPQVNDDHKEVPFECWQRVAGYHLERLHGCVEKELAAFLVSTKPHPGPDEFLKYLSNLRDLTAVTKSVFKNFVEWLESGLKDQLIS